jgi:hypothetical protein
LQFKNDRFVHQIGGELVRGRTHSIVLCYHQAKFYGTIRCVRNNTIKANASPGYGNSSPSAPRSSRLCLIRKDWCGDGQRPVPLAPWKNET